MATESAAAIAGGVTTVCEMPNTIPPTVTAEALADKIRRASEIHGCDLHFFFGITKDIHLATLIELMTSSSEECMRLRRRIAGVKVYLDHSTGDQKIEDLLLDDVFATCAAHDLVLVAHCEDPATNAQAALQNTRTNIAAHSLVRPAQSEVVAIERAIKLAEDHDTRLHIAHLSTEGGIAAVQEAKVEGINVTCEVAPHHLFLTTDDYERLGTLGKMNPPLRSQKHRFALWQGIMDGIVDCVSTDHAPHTLEEKQAGEPLQAPSGVPGVETMIPLLLSVAAGHWPNPAEQNAACPKLSIKDIERLCFENPNRIFKLGKQGIAKGNTADIVVIDPEEIWTIDAKKLHSKCGWSPFDGWTVKGKVDRVLSA
jgi:dihydroorotase